MDFIIFLRAFSKSYWHRLISCDFCSSEFCINLVNPRCILTRQDVVLDQNIGDEDFNRDKCPAYCRTGTGADAEAKPVVVLERVRLIIVETVRVE